MLTLTLRVTHKYVLSSTKIKSPLSISWALSKDGQKRSMGYAKKYERNKRCHAKEAWAKKKRIKDAMPKKHEPKKEKKDNLYFSKLQRIEAWQWSTQNSKILHTLAQILIKVYD